MASDLADLFDVDNVGDFINDGVGLLKKTFNSLFDTDMFPADGQFAGVVLTNPVEIPFSEYQALGYTGGDIESDNSYYKFKVRITNKRSNPHAVLEDPCDITKTEEICQQNGLIASHTTIATSGSPGVNIGSFVTIRLNKLPNKSFNLQTGHLVEVLLRNDTGAEILNSDACESMALMFEYGESYSPPPTIIVNSDVKYFAQLYDQTPEIKYKDNHSKKFEAYIKRNSPFVDYFKALAYLAYERDGTGIFFTGKAAGVRTQAQQERLRKKFDKDLAAYNAAIARGETAKPPYLVGKNLGYHGAALAADINLELTKTIDTGGVTYGPGFVGGHKAAFHANTQFSTIEGNKILWHASNIVKYAQELGLEWGGNFSRYDPMHFQYTPPGYDLEKIKMAARDNSTYGTATEQGDGSIGADVEAAKFDAQQQQKDADALRESSLGIGVQYGDDIGAQLNADADMDANFDEIFGYVPEDFTDYTDAASVSDSLDAESEAMASRSTHSDYKSETTSSRFRGGAASNVDFDKFDVD
jgi:hypothetical protein